MATSKKSSALEALINRDELLVFGYVRNIESTLSDNKIIPTGVTRQCYDYYHLVKCYIY